MQWKVREDSLAGEVVPDVLRQLIITVAPICDFIVTGLPVVLIHTPCFPRFLTQCKKFTPTPDSAYKPSFVSKH